MNYLVIEDSRAPLFSRDFFKNTPKDSIFRITKRTLYKDLDDLKKSPLFTNKWFVLIENKVGNDMIEKMKDHTDVDVIVLADRNNYVSKRSYLLKLGEFKVIDLVNPSKDYCERFVINELGVTKDTAKVLLGRSNYFLPTIVENVNLLKCLGRTPTTNDVNLYVSRRTSVTVYTLFYYILNNSKVKPKTILLFLHEFRFAFNYVKTRLIELFDVSMKIYDSVESGTLGGSNCIQFIEDNNLDVTEYFVRIVITDLHPKITYEKLYLEKLRISRIENIVELLNFIL